LAWTVRFAAAAEKTLSKLDPPIARRIVRKLEDIAAGDPRRDWRVICDLADGSRTITVVCVGHRSDVYRH
jgi:mRNA-degrading endonuclease RelE of RelBE toxin-antitoxin system